MFADVSGGRRLSASSGAAAMETPRAGSVPPHFKTSNQAPPSEVLESLRASKQARSYERVYTDQGSSKQSSARSNSPLVFPSPVR